MNQKFLKWLIYAGLFAIPFLAYDITFSGTFFPYITGRSFAFRIIVEIILAAWLVLAFYEPRYRPKFSYILAGFAAFAGILTLATIFGENPFRSFWSNFERMEGLVLHLHLFAYFVVAASVLQTDKLWRAFINTSLAASVLVGFYGIAQLIGSSEFFHDRMPALAKSFAESYPITQGGVRLDATFGNAIYLAVYAMFHVFLATFMMVRAWGVRWQRWIYAAVAVVNLLILYHTASRGAQIGLVGGAFVALTLLALFEKRSPFLRKAAAGALAALVLMAGSFYVMRDSDFVQNSPVLARIASISLTDTTTRSRFLLWSMTLEGFREQPILGYGPENYNLVFNTHYDPQMYGQEQWFDRSHNAFLDWLMAAGILGLGAYLFMLYSGFAALWRRRLPVEEKGAMARMRAWINEHITHNVHPGEGLTFAEKSILTGLLVAYILQSATVFDNLFSYILLFSVLAYIHTLATQEKEPMFAGVNVSKESAMIASGAVVAIAGMIMYTVNIPSIRANTTLLSAMRAQDGFTRENVRNFERALELSRSGTGQKEVREQLVHAALALRSNPNVSEGVRRDLMALAEREVRAQVERTPNDARDTYFAGTFFMRTGQYNEAEPYVLRSLELSPNKQQFLFELVTLRINQERYDEALAAARKAYELAPEYRDAGRVYGLAAVYAGEMELADEILVPLYGSREVPEDSFIRAYAMHGEYDTVLRLMQVRIKEEPENPDLRLMLAQQYIDMDEREKAIEEIEKVIEMYPDFKDQGEYYINEIREGRNP